MVTPCLHANSKQLSKIAGFVASFDCSGSPLTKCLGSKLVSAYNSLQISYNIWKPNNRCQEEFLPFSKPISCYSFLTECSDQKMTLLLLNSMVSLLLKVTAICQPTLPLCCGHTLCMTPYIGHLPLGGYGYGLDTGQMCFSIRITAADWVEWSNTSKSLCFRPRNMKQGS